MRQIESFAAKTPIAAAPPAPAAPADANLRQRAYDRIMEILLGQTVNAGPDQGKRNPYRSFPRPKAVAACVDWSAGSTDGLRVGAWADSHVLPGTVGVPPAQDAISRCEK